jgi:hypothetical protein
MEDIDDLQRVIRDFSDSNIISHFGTENTRLLRTLTQTFLKNPQAHSFQTTHEVLQLKRTNESLLQILGPWIRWDLEDSLEPLFLFRGIFERSSDVFRCRSKVIVVFAEGTIEGQRFIMAA